MITPGKLILIKKFDDAIASDFLISQYPVTKKKFQEILGLESDDSSSNKYAQKTTWMDAIRYCNILSVKNGLPLSYKEATGQLINEKRRRAKTISAAMGFRLPTMKEWEYAAKGWSESKMGDYSAIQKKTYRILYLDYPMQDDDEEVYFRGYSDIEKTVMNRVGLYGMVGNSHEWYGDCNAKEGLKNKMCRWEEYIVNYSNDFAYQVKTEIRKDTDVFPFRVVVSNQDFRKYYNECQKRREAAGSGLD
jgi:formylglycine-generating enzyme required for sulfatase activity